MRAQDLQRAEQFPFVRCRAAIEDPRALPGGWQAIVNFYSERSNPTVIEHRADAAD
jgi:hypothetical protein